MRACQRQYQRTEEGNDRCVELPGLFLAGYVFFLQIVIHGFTAQVHKRGRFYDNKRFAFELTFTAICQSRRAEIRIKFLYKCVKNFKSDIVAGIIVFWTGIAQANNKKLIHLSKSKDKKNPLR